VQNVFKISLLRILLVITTGFSIPSIAEDKKTVNLFGNTYLMPVHVEGELAIARPV
jgi:hypothetical protein